MQNCPPFLKRPLNLAFLQNGTNDQVVAHREKKVELSGLENDGALTTPTMTALPPNDNQQNTEKLKPYAITVKNQATLLEIAVKG